MGRQSILPLRVQVSEQRLLPGIRRYYMGRLYCIPVLQQLEKYEAFSERYQAAFEYNEFFAPGLLDDDAGRERVIQRYMGVGRDRSHDTLHGAFLDVCVNSADERIFRVSDYRIRQCMDIAQRLGCRAVIFHTNYIVNFRLQSYLDSWIDRNEEYWREIIRDYPEQLIYMENMFDDTPGLLGELAERMEDEPHFQVCLDTAHALISGSPLKAWLERLSPYTAHIHINDNDGAQDLHRPVGEGVFPWELYDGWVRSFDQGREPSVLIEVRTFEDLERSVRYMREHKLYPFPR